MSVLDNLNLNNLHDLIDKVAAAEPSPDNVSVAQNSTSTTDIVQLEILKHLKELRAGMDNVISELTAVKLELMDYKKLAQENEKKIQNLEAENKLWQEKAEENEVRNRANTLLLSGPAVKINNSYSPSQLRDQSIKNIKEIYNFDLQKYDVYNCQPLRTKDNTITGQILLMVNNAIVKNELISAVIKKDKRNGINLNIGEFLTKRNSNVLYQLRNLRRNHKGKIFSCFSRNGSVFYKLTKEARPIKITGQPDIDDLARKVGTASTTTNQKPENHQPQHRTQQNWRQQQSRAGNQTEPHFWT